MEVMQREGARGSLMEIAAVALGIIASIVDMVKQAKNASAEKSAEIAARLTAAEAALKGAADEAHAGARRDQVGRVAPHGGVAARAGLPPRVPALP
jgi:hypothetical protein